MTEAQLLELYKTGTKYRKQLLAMPLAQLAALLQYMTLRTGVRGKEVVGELDADVELRPYRTSKDASDSTTIELRELETFLGDDVREFDPHLLAASVYGNAIATKPTETDIVKAVALRMAAKASKKLRTHLFTAKRNAAGNGTKDLFNGFCTILGNEITAGKIATANENLIDIGTVNRANVIDKLMGIYEEGACEELQEENSNLFLPRDIYNLYGRAYQDEFGPNAFNKQYRKRTLEGTDDLVTFAPMVGMKGTGLMFLTVRENVLVGCDQKSDQEEVRIRECDNPKVAQFFMKLFFGVEFETISKERLLVVKYATE